MKIETIIKKAGGGSKLASAVTKTRGQRPLSPQAVSQWEQVPILRVKAVSAITDIPPHRIRPDVFPRP